MNAKTAFVARAVLCGLSILACRDATEPGCRRVVCAITGIAVSGSVVAPGNESVAALIHLTLFNTEASPGIDTLEHCAGTILRDTLVLANAATGFHILLTAGIPYWVDGCLVLRATPDAASRLRPSVMTYSDFVLRDTAAHDTLHAVIAVQP